MDVREHDAEVQEIYARWLDLGTRAGFAASLVAFLVYVSGAVPAYLPLEALPRYWGLPVGEYLRQTGAPSGWDWLSHLGGGAEYLNLACMALLGVVTMLCYMRIVPVLLRLGERVQATLALTQIAVLLAAASGFFAGG
jgi:tetrahydromethanopterin S-methyltransferase subunit H